jgi:cyclopropane-fatty-acyl-phospholipid synthase
MSELVGAIERTGWQLGDVEILRYHYAHTLAEWYRRTTLHADKITAMYDEPMLRMWQFIWPGPNRRSDRAAWSISTFRASSVRMFCP